MTSFKLPKILFYITAVFSLCVGAVFAQDDISPEEFLKIDNSKRLLLDVRTTNEYSDGFIPTAVNIPVAELAENYSKLQDKDQQIVVYCRSGVRAARAIDFLESKGFTNLVHLDGDFGQWQKDERKIMKLK